jgi:hypothetical protein
MQINYHRKLIPPFESLPQHAWKVVLGPHESATEINGDSKSLFECAVERRRTPVGE